MKFAIMFTTEWIIQVLTMKCLLSSKINVAVKNIAIPTEKYVKNPAENQNSGFFIIESSACLLIRISEYPDKAWIIKDSPVRYVELYAAGPGS